MPLPETVEVPKPAWCDLPQAMFWIAYDEEPLFAEYERALRGYVPNLKMSIGAEC